MPNDSTLPTWERDEQGLYKHITYVRKSDNRIDWRKMIEPDTIVPNSERTSETDVSKLEDKDLLILLRGFKELAKLRGYLDFRTTVRPVSPEFIAAETYIKWMPCFETQGNAVISSGTADAHVGNVTNNIAANFLTTIAENRSFVRCVRNFLDVPILGQDELGAVEPIPSRSSTEEHSILEDLLKDNNIKFESFKNKMIKLKVEGAEDWGTINDVPKNKIFEVAETVRAALNAKKAAAK